MVKRDISTKSELLRKIFHICAGIAFFSIALFIETQYGKDWLLRALFIGIIMSLIMDHLRIEQGYQSHILRFLQRAREVGRLHATTYAFIGALLSFVFFSRDIAYAAIAMFFIGDAAAAIFGRLWGKRKLYRNKSVLGSSCMFFFNAVAGSAITGSLFIGVTMSLVAMIIEALSEKMDDSFLIMLFAGITGHLLRIFL